MTTTELETEVIVDHDKDEKHDLDVQYGRAQALLKAENDGNLIGAEAPVFKCHTFSPCPEGESHAKILTQQLNHLAEALGLLAFQVSYKEDSLSPLATRPDRGYFQIRMFANAPKEEEAVA